MCLVTTVYMVLCMLFDHHLSVLCFQFTPDNMHEYTRQLQRFNVGEDCPVFDGLFEFCQMYTSGSIGKHQCESNKRSLLLIS